MLCETKCSYKFRKFHNITPVLESFFNRVEKQTPTVVLSREICEVFKNFNLEEHLRMTEVADVTSKHK